MLLLRGHDGRMIMARSDTIGDFFIWAQSRAVDVAPYAGRLGPNTIFPANCRPEDYVRTTGRRGDVDALDSKRFMRVPLHWMRPPCSLRRSGVGALSRPRSARLPPLEHSLVRASTPIRRIGSPETFLNTNKISCRKTNCLYDGLIQMDHGETTREIACCWQLHFGLAGGEACRSKFRSISNSKAADFLVIARGTDKNGRISPMAKLILVCRHTKHECRLLHIGPMALHADVHPSGRLATLVSHRKHNDVGKATLFAYVKTIAAAKMVIRNRSFGCHIAVRHGRNVFRDAGDCHYGDSVSCPPDCRSRTRTITLTAAMNIFGRNRVCKCPRPAYGAFRYVASISVEVVIAGVKIPLRERRGPDRDPDCESHVRALDSV